MDIKECIQGYIGKMKHVHNVFLDFLEDENDNNEEVNFQDLIRYLEIQKIQESKYALKETLHLISKISENHQRTKCFLNRIERILKTFETAIKDNFSNLSIFNIFKNNKRVLLFLFEEKILIPDKSIYNIIVNGKYKLRNYPQYFYNEFESFMDEKTQQKIKTSNPEINEPESYEQKRKIGENDSILSQLIRNDSLNEFISFVNRENMNLRSNLSHSIYETNSLLNKKKFLSIVEYAAFFGSINIFKYLTLQNVSIPYSSWMFAVHGQNAELIHLIEEKNIKPTKDCYLESIKCHHINISDYIENILSRNELLINASKVLPYYNYAFLYNNDWLNRENNENNLFYILCKYDYLTIVNSLLQNQRIDINFKHV